MKFKFIVVVLLIALIIGNLHLSNDFFGTASILFAFIFYAFLRMDS
jgi:hypothetical protein